MLSYQIFMEFYVTLPDTPWFIQLELNVIRNNWDKLLPKLHSSALGIIDTK